MVLNDGARYTEAGCVDFQRFFYWTLRFRLGVSALLGANSSMGVGGFGGTRNSVSMSSSEV
jgi:hypothetical protein